MRKALTIAVILIPLSVFAITCDHNSPHLSANNCITQGCDPTDENYLLCEKCCDQICIECHGFGDNVIDFSDPTKWNQFAAQMDEVYPELAEGTEFTLADVCIDCHEDNPEPDRFSEGHNHPVDIPYDSDALRSQLLSSPAGPLLICDQGASGTTDCMMRCVTCHMLHPDEEGAFEKVGLLRMSNSGSALCLACHVK